MKTPTINKTKLPSHNQLYLLLIKPLDKKMAKGTKNGIIAPNGRL